MRAAVALILVMMLLSAPVSADLKEVEDLIAVGRHAAALELLDDLLAENPSDPRALFLQGVGLAETGEFDDAIQVFTRLTNEYPRMPEPYNNLAVLHAMRGDLEEARQVLLAAIRTQPDNPGYYENLGDVYLELAGRAYARGADFSPFGGSANDKLDLLEELFKVAATEDPSTPADAREDNEAEPIASVSAIEAQSAICEEAVVTIHVWANAWSSQDAEGYLSLYDPEFTPASGQARGEWEALRRSRLKRAGSIDVALENIEVDICADRRARVTFEQIYSSDIYLDRTRKELWLSRPAEDWRITSERVIE